LDRTNAKQKFRSSSVLLGKRIEMRFSSTARVNSLVWISSLDDHDKGTTRRVIEDLEPYFNSIALPFVFVEPKTKSELIAVLSSLAKRAKDGLHPIIQFDTHGSAKDGIYVAPSKEFVPWQSLIDRLRDINVNTANNLCVVSAACFSMSMIKQIVITDQTPFYMMIAPQRAVTFGFVEQKTLPFYRGVFDGSDIYSSYEKSLASDFSIFHCEKLLAVALTKYIRNHCIGRGAALRREELVTRAIKKGLPNTRQNRKIARKLAKTMIRPNQQLIDRYARSFLIGRVVPFSIADVMALACGAQKASGKAIS
jgi:hypothetical protein